MPGDTDVTYQYLASPNVPTVKAANAPDKGFADYNTFFTLTAKQGGNDVIELSRPATIEVKFSMAQIDSHVALDDVHLYCYDEGAKTWTTSGVSVMARGDNLLTASTKRLGQFAVTGQITPCMDFVAPAGSGQRTSSPSSRTRTPPPSSRLPTTWRRWVRPMASWTTRTSTWFSTRRVSSAASRRAAE